MDKYIDEIIKLASIAEDNDEIPVGCIIVCNNEIIGRGYNTKESSNKCICHAEINAINQAEDKKGDWRLDDCEMYVTLKPCKMCEEVIRQSRIKKVHYLLDSNFINEDKKIIEINKINNKNIEDKYREKIQRFFSNKR